MEASNIPDEMVSMNYTETANPADTTPSQDNTATMNFMNTNTHTTDEFNQEYTQTEQPPSQNNYNDEHNNGIENINHEDMGATNEGYVSCNPAPMVEIKLFCGRVPKTMNEDDIKKLFEEFGIVKEVVIIRDKESNVHKSSAFVRMASIAHADSAIQALNGQKTLDPAMGPVQVKYANNETSKLSLSDTTATEPGVHQAKVFVGSLPKTVNEEMIRNLFAPYGNVDEVFIMTDKATGVGKGCSFVKFAYKEQALYAMKSLDGKQTLEGCSRPIEVRFAESKTRTQTPNLNQFTTPAPTYTMLPTTLPIMNPNTTPLPPPNTRSSGNWKEYISNEGRPYYHNEQTQVVQWERPPDFDTMNNSSSMPPPGAFGPKGANIFIFYIPNEWTHNDLVSAFATYGTIISARIATDRHTGRNKGYAFVSYDSAHSAANAVHNMNGYLTPTKRLKVSIKKGEESYVDHMMNSMPTGPNNTNNNSGNGGDVMRNNNTNNNFYPISGQSAQYGGYMGSRYAPY